MLARHGLRADKALGQHFLVSDAVIEKILARLGAVKGVLEIGPGPGVLTGPMSGLAQVVAVELDRRMVEILSETAPDASVLQQDALKADWLGLIGSLPKPAAIVSNMPYNITGPLLQRVCDCHGLIDRAVLMMQREVAERILASPGDSARGSLSVVIQAQFEVKRVCHVPPGAFLPPPKVESTVLELIPTPGGLETQAVLKVVSAGFGQPRKTLANNLSALLGTEEAHRRIEAAGLEPKVRAHQLTWEQWCRIAQ